jgi:hypothetical protein
MGWKTDQYLSPEEVIETVINRALKPAIASTCSRLGLLPILARVGVWVEDELQSKFQVVGTGSQEAPLNAQIRLRLRRTIKAERSLFFAQLKLDDVDVTSGFAGLIVKGEVSGSEKPSVKTRSCTAIFHRCEWIDPAGI